MHIVGITAEVISRQINQHDMFRIFFRVFQKRLRQCFVFFVIAGSAESACNRVDRSMSFRYFAVGFGTRTEYPERTEVKIKQIRRRIDGTQSAVHLKIITRKRL